MVSHFDAWLGEAHGIRFAFETGSFGEAMTDRATGELVAEDRVWPLLDRILPRRNASPDAGPGRARGARPDRRGRRHRHPHQFGRRGPSRGGSTSSPATASATKSSATAAARACRPRAIIERYGAGPTVFVDDLPVHHASVAKHAPEVHRLHMVAEPRLAPAVPTAEHAHARIDDWPTATHWIFERLGAQ